MPRNSSNMQTTDRRVQVGILGGTGLVGRMLARVLVSHPIFRCGPIVGSRRSVGKLFEDVWRSKEEALTKHYGDQLWTPDYDIPQELKGVVVSSLDQLIESSCKVAISAIAPRLGKLEDVLAENGFTVVSISPYKRQESVLCVLEANHNLMLSQILSQITRDLNLFHLLSTSSDSVRLSASSDSLSELDSSSCSSPSDGRSPSPYVSNVTNDIEEKNQQTKKSTISPSSRDFNESRLLSTSLDSLRVIASSDSLSGLEFKSSNDSSFCSSPSDGRSPSPSPVTAQRTERLIKSPNCVCCGTSTVLSALANAFGVLDEVSVTTFQSLSGRGDAMYSRELVIGNVYPLGGTAEPTEALIQEELQTVMGPHLNSVSVSAYRVSVQRGHLVDVRIKLADRKVAQSLLRNGNKAVETVYQRLEQFDPLKPFRQSGLCPSVPAQSIVCNRNGGCPRPKTHFSGRGSGLSVTVGNVKVGSGPYDICLTLVVDNLVKGALGAALQLLEFRNYVAPLRDVASRVAD